VSRPPFGHDADLDDPLTKLRIAVTRSHPMSSYLVAFDRESEARPTEREAKMLASYLAEYKHHYYKGGPFERQMTKRPLDVDNNANGVIFRKWAEDDWGLRRQSQDRGPLYVPMSPSARKAYPRENPLGPLTLQQLMDWDHAKGVGDEPLPRWVAWKAAHPEVFGEQ
jgi:hypothetical protein